LNKKKEVFHRGTLIKRGLVAHGLERTIGRCRSSALKLWCLTPALYRQLSE